MKNNSFLDICIPFAWKIFLKLNVMKTVYSKCNLEFYDQLITRFKSVPRNSIKSLEKKSS